ncbi:uncharacterized protein [Aquarana catesbeiana]|uniref:uncharacterized protein n=1 Tax=Aquarana catesbeiana TaxID=8400 RepID=UPI003CC9EF87
MRARRLTAKHVLNELITVNITINKKDVHHDPWLRAVPFGQFMRLRRNCTEVAVFDKQAAVLSNRFVEKGYDPRTLSQTLDKEGLVPGDNEISSRRALDTFTPARSTVTGAYIPPEFTLAEFDGMAIEARMLGDHASVTVILSSPKTTTITYVTDKPSFTEMTTFQTITTLPPSISTTPLDPNLSSTETLNAATTSTSKLTPAPELYSTMGTTSISVKPPGSQATDQPGLSDNSTQISTAESFSENNPVVNSSIILPTRNNVSTTGNISSSHPIHPAATTTPTVTTSPWVKHTTVQQLTTSSTLATTPPYVTTNSGSLPVTTTDSNGRSSAAKPSPPSITDTQVGMTKITETSLTDSTTSKSTRPPSGILTSTKTPASSTSSDFKRTTQGIISVSTTASSTQTRSSSQPSSSSLEVNTTPLFFPVTANTSLSTLSPALSGMTESLVSESVFTSIATSENSKKPGQATTVSYFVVSMSLKFSDAVTDADEVASFVKSMVRHGNVLEKPRY